MREFKDAVTGGGDDEPKAQQITEAAKAVKNDETPARAAA
jgi:hypothetical protein